MSTTDLDEQARRAWKLMFELLVATSGQRTEALSRRGLTPNDARALWSLDAENGRPIGDLAREWSCDPSNATYIVDRLEKAGLAERRSSLFDRRVKQVVLTAAGLETRTALNAEYLIPPAEMLQLDLEDLKALEQILSKITTPS